MKTLFLTLGLWNIPIIRYFPNGAEVVLGPLLYFYVYSLIDVKFEFKWKFVWHFIPFILSQSYAFFVYFSVFDIPDLGQKDLIANSFWFNEVKDTEDHLALISIVVYVTLGYKKLKVYRKWLNNTVSDNTFPDFNWLRNIFILISVLGVFLLINLSLDFFFNLKETYYFHWEAYLVFFAFIIYYLGFVGYKQPHFQFEKVESPPTQPKASKVSNERNGEIVKVLVKALQEDRIFLNPTLNLQQVSRLLGIPQRDLSLVINHSFKKNFRDLINDYRIEEVKLKLNNSEFDHMSILGIALECGFNSEASFYRIFKKNTGMSPKEYAHKLKES
ncbi:helix-turn-helix domain-containing protein [Xanthovirga aplysinae]|uniref:helix-turn-helix domain-containing protein n=1 Tax=Xanthovirga aplysinae TaxID=2529853 RepID=UPI0012BBA2D7|nr:AraC family transcriptional regulator [Xanthovirga aplysinae]MTI32334.1 AraC family transcriptional regulator [Xanthovirga aplysinae]